MLSNICGFVNPPPLIVFPVSVADTQKTYKLEGMNNTKFIPELVYWTMSGQSYEFEYEGDEGFEFTHKQRSKYPRVGADHGFMDYISSFAPTWVGIPNEYQHCLSVTNDVYVDVTRFNGKSVTLFVSIIGSIGLYLSNNTEWCDAQKQDTRIVVDKDNPLHTIPANMLRIELQYKMAAYNLDINLHDFTDYYSVLYRYSIFDGLLILENDRLYWDGYLCIDLHRILDSKRLDISENKHVVTYRLTESLDAFDIWDFIRNRGEKVNNRPAAFILVLPYHFIHCMGRYIVESKYDTELTPKLRRKLSCCMNGDFARIVCKYLVRPLPIESLTTFEPP